VKVEASGWLLPLGFSDPYDQAPAGLLLLLKSLRISQDWALVLAAPKNRAAPRRGMYDQRIFPLLPSEMPIQTTLIIT
jgi:hypothetical protein